MLLHHLVVQARIRNGATHWPTNSASCCFLAILKATDPRIEQIAAPRKMLDGIWAVTFSMRRLPGLPGLHRRLRDSRSFCKSPWAAYGRLLTEGCEKAKTRQLAPEKFCSLRRQLMSLRDRRRTSVLRKSRTLSVSKSPIVPLTFNAATKQKPRDRRGASSFTGDDCPNNADRGPHAPSILRAGASHPGSGPSADARSTRPHTASDSSSPGASDSGR